MKRKGQFLGALLLIQLACGLILPYVFLLPLTAPPAAFLDHAAGMSMTIRLNVLMLLIGGALPFVISLILIRSHQDREWTVGAVLLVLAAATFVLQIIENTYWLSMLSVSETYRSADAKGGFEVAGIAVRSGFKWAHYSHILVVIGWLFTLYLLWFRAGVVPRVLAVAGMVGCVLHFGGIILPAFAGVTMPYSTLFGIPLALVTVLASGWLLARGMTNPNSAVDPASSDSR
jgi:hypothetical protein